MHATRSRGHEPARRRRNEPATRKRDRLATGCAVRQALRPADRCRRASPGMCRFGTVSAAGRRAASTTMKALTAQVIVEDGRSRCGHPCPTKRSKRAARWSQSRSATTLDVRDASKHAAFRASVPAADREAPAGIERALNVPPGQRRDARSTAERGACPRLLIARALSRAGLSLPTSPRGSIAGRRSSGPDRPDCAPRASRSDDTH